MPFCSERCKLVDLANWAEEKYVIAAPLSLDELADLDIPSEDEESNR